MAIFVPDLVSFDLEAPLPLPSAERVPFERGVDLIRGAFGRAYPRLREYFDAMFERRWIESEARANPELASGYRTAASDPNGGMTMEEFSRWHSSRATGQTTPPGN